MDSSLLFHLRQFGYLLPVIIFCVVAIAIAMINFSAHRKAATYVLAGAGVLLIKGVLVALGHAILHQVYVVGDGGDFEVYGRLSLGLSILGILGEVLGLSLLLAAAFVGRRGGSNDMP